MYTSYLLSDPVTYLFSNLPTSANKDSGVQETVPSPKQAEICETDQAITELFNQAESYRPAVNVLENASQKQHLTQAQRRELSNIDQRLDDIVNVLRALKVSPDTSDPQARQIYELQEQVKYLINGPDKTPYILPQEEKDRILAETIRVQKIKNDIKEAIKQQPGGYLTKEQESKLRETINAIDDMLTPVFANREWEIREIIEEANPEAKTLKRLQTSLYGMLTIPVMANTVAPQFSNLE